MYIIHKVEDKKWGIALESLRASQCLTLYYSGMKRMVTDGRHLTVVLSYFRAHKEALIE